MTTASSAARERPEFWPWLGHNAWWVGMTFASGLAVFSLAGVFFPGVGTADWAGLIIAPVIGAFFVVMLMENHHNRRLCEQCIAATPLDTQGAVDKHRRALRLAHRVMLNGTRRRQLVVIGGGLLALLVLMLILPIQVSSALSVVVYSAANSLAWSNEQHRRLKPWCPFCERGKRWGDGGPKEPSPKPVPSYDPERDPSNPLAAR